MKRINQVIVLSLLLVCLLAVPASVQAKSELPEDNGGTKILQNDTYTLKSGKMLNGQNYCHRKHCHAGVRFHCEWQCYFVPWKPHRCWQNQWQSGLY